MITIFCQCCLNFFFIEGTDLNWFLDFCFQFLNLLRLEVITHSFKNTFKFILLFVCLEFHNAYNALWSYHLTFFLPTPPRSIPRPTTPNVAFPSPSKSLLILICAAHILLGVGPSTVVWSTSQWPRPPRKLTPSSSDTINCQQLLSQGVGLVNLFVLHASVLIVLVLSRSCAGNHSCWELEGRSSVLSRRHCVSLILPHLGLLKSFCPALPLWALSLGRPRVVILARVVWYRCSICGRALYSHLSLLLEQLGVSVLTTMRRTKEHL